MASETRNEAEIRAELTAEREQLVGALADLRASVAAKRQPAAVVGGVAAAATALVVLRGIARRLRG
ncbi:MAG: hypothetical protein KatS3mg012_0951 [Gaiellaceae bacterium]|nr:MAG: hypothetical protein KatS3mg012_0951 [Gaiellaceae bacterium]